MYKNRIEYLKSEIERAYKRYTGERTDGKATIKDVAKYFSIPIEETRLEDYCINKIDYKTPSIEPSIEIRDAKTMTTYTATYTCKADLLRYYGAMEFNKVVSTNPLRKEEILYYIESETPIITRMTFTKGEYDLVLERQMTNLVIKSSIYNGDMMDVRYLQNIIYDGKNRKQLLFNKSYTKGYKNDIGRTFEQIYTYGNDRFIKWDDTQYKCTYIENNNIIYRINELEKERFCNYLEGICFENTNVNVSKYLPYSIDEKDFPELTNEMYQSGIVFRGGTGNGIHHTFTIFKTKNQDGNKKESEENTIGYDIYLKYEAIKWENFKKENGEPDHKKVIVAYKETRYPRINIGNITSLEIRNITEVLDIEFEDDTFIQIIINELKTFANKMDIQKGIVQEELDALSPKLLMDKSFEEIAELIASNKEEYFKLAAEQFENATNITFTKEKEQARILQSNTPQKK